MLRALVLVMLVVGIARADAPKPWADGVPADQQERALALYKEGNALFEQDQYKDALPKYQAALALWDHPAIHYNAAVCLINLERPVEAYDHLLAALKFGAAPLGDKLYRDALNYKKALAGQVAPLEVSCAQADAKITLDGAELAKCPATVEKNVLAADHQLVALKQGYETETRTIHLEPGKKTTLVIELHQIARGGHLVRRWRRATPWTIAIGGAAVALAGVPVYLLGRSTMSDYDGKVAATCPNGCPASMVAQYASIESRAKLEGDIGVGMLVAGGAVAAVGFAMVVMNQPRLEHVQPQVGGDHVGLVISGRW